MEQSTTSDNLEVTNPYGSLKLPYGQVSMPVFMPDATLGVLLGQLLGLLQCKKPSRVRVERDERKQLRWALIREEPTPR